MTKLTQPLKIHGGKAYLATRIVNMMPSRCKNPNKPDPADKGWLNYCEPYFGGGSVLLANDPEGISEVVNDLDEHLTNFWRVLQHPDRFEKFCRLMEAMPFSEAEYDKASAQLHDLSDDPVLAARDFFIRCRQSLAGRRNCFASPVRNRTRRGMNEHASAWLGAVGGLPAIHERFRRVLIVGPKEATEVILEQDGQRSLFYIDPPYFHSTRTATDVYEHEMNAQAHANLLVALGGAKIGAVILEKKFEGIKVQKWWYACKKLSGRFLLSGYQNDLYDVVADQAGWKRTDFDIANHAAGGDEKRRMTESVWHNYEIEA